MDLPPGEKAIGSSWVFRIKRHSDGSIERYKARIVAQGCSQRPGRDYLEVARAYSTSCDDTDNFAIAAAEDLELRSVDISAAFTNGDLDEYIYMRLLEMTFQTQTDGGHLTYVLVAVEHRLKSLVTHFGLQASSIALNILSYSLWTSEPRSCLV